MQKNLLGAIATLVGTTIGAGILGLPYVVSRIGLLTGLIHVIIIGACILFLNLALGEVVLRTRGRHQLSGYAEIYMGKFGKLVMIFTMMFGLYGALTAYLIGEGYSLAAILGNNQYLYILMFFAVASILVLMGLRVVKKFELVLATLMLITIITIITLSARFIDVNNLQLPRTENYLFPLGAILFAFLALPAIPEMNEELSRNKKLLKRAVIIGTLIPLLVYLSFIVTMIGNFGSDVNEIVTIGFGQSLNYGFFLLGNLFAVISMGTAFLALALALKQMYIYDLKLNETVAWILTCFIPLILVLLGANSFIKVISIGGSIAGSVSGVLILLMWQNAKKTGRRKPEYFINLRKFLIVIIGFVLVVVFLNSIVTLF